MPFIDLKISVPVTDEQKEKIVEQLGKDISIMNKLPAHLMIGINDKYALWMGGKKAEKGAYVSFAGFGDVDSELSKKMSVAVNDMLTKELGLDGKQVFITYVGIHNWAWDGKNF